MKDRFGRIIDYMRISITDRCDLRCAYCMPAGVPDIPHSDILRYEETLRVVRAAVGLGIDRFKVTGGEPFVRKGAADFIAALKAEPGVRCGTVTTNGTHLSEALPQLAAAGVDGVNISLDAVDAARYEAITGGDQAKRVLTAVEQCVGSGIRTKVNSVLLDDNQDQIIPLAALAQRMNVDVRFIELMPIGCGREHSGPDCDTALSRLKEAYPDLHRVDGKRGNGPAVYYASAQLMGRIGFIAANSHSFCAGCNRVRLTSIGLVKPCLCDGSTVDLRALLRGGATDAQLVAALEQAVWSKPAAHRFSEGGTTERRRMNQIGG
jgi:cyclic pyranopterin phosphate synthase